MCQPGQRPAPAPPASVADAVATAKTALAFLASAETAALPAATAAECLRELEQAAAMHVAARARMLSGFAAQRGFEADGQGSAGSWLRWQTRITRGAAAEACAWARRLAAHPAVADALAAGDISASWAKAICGWTIRLPAHKQPDADAILLAAAAGGAELADLAGLAEEMHKRCAPADACGDGGDGGFADRWLRLDLTLHGAGRLQGDLTPACAAALQAVLESLGKKAGQEDVRSKAKRDHDALEEACRRLVGAGCLPERAGQPTQIQLHMTLDQLRGLDGAGAAEAAWGQAAWACRGPGAPPGAECDSSIVPIVSGHVDPVLLDRLAAALRGQHASRPAGLPPSADSSPGHGGGAGAGAAACRGPVVRPGRAGRVPADRPAGRPGGQHQPAAGRGPGYRADPGSLAARGDRQGPVLRFPRLRPAAGGVPGASCPAAP